MPRSREPGGARETILSSPKGGGGGLGPPPPPGEVPLHRLMKVENLLSQADTLTRLLQTASAVFFLENESRVSPLFFPEGTTFFANDYFRLLRRVFDAETERPLIMEDFWRACRRAIQEERSLEEDSFLGKKSLWASPLLLVHNGKNHPKGALVTLAFPAGHLVPPGALVQQFPQFLSNVAQDLESSYQATLESALSVPRLEQIRHLQDRIARASSDELTAQYKFLLTLQDLKTRTGEVEELNRTLRSITRQFALEKINVLESNARLEVQKYRTSEMAHHLKREMDGILAVHRLREELYRELSHELKTPLTTIRAFAEILSSLAGEEGEEGEDKARAKEFLKIIQDESERLAQLVDQMLSLARLEAGREVKNLEPLNPGQLVSQVLRIFQARARGSGLTFQGEVSPDLPTVHWARDQVHRLLMNLIDNAIRFAPPEGTVAVRAYRETWEGREAVAIEVEDDGPGIPEEKRPLVFKKFFSTPPPNPTTRKGTGLGLSICLGIARAHGGTISVGEGSLGGALFKVLLPASPDLPEESL